MLGVPRHLQEEDVWTVRILTQQTQAVSVKNVLYFVAAHARGKSDDNFISLIEASGLVPIKAIRLVATSVQLFVRSRQLRNDLVPTGGPCMTPGWSVTYSRLPAAKLPSYVAGSDYGVLRCGNWTAARRTGTKTVR